jgi:hypothetical protein
MKKNKLAPGCYFIPEEDEAINPVVGKRLGGLLPPEPSVFKRRSELDDIPDDFVKRMKALRGKTQQSFTPTEHEVKTPDGFAVSIAYNKSGYQVIPKEDLKG